GWPPGITCSITADGQISDVRGHRAGDWRLSGLRAFTAGAQDTAELLDLLTTPPRPTTSTLTGRTLVSSKHPTHHTADHHRDPPSPALPGQLRPTAGPATPPPPTRPPSTPRAPAPAERTARQDSADSPRPQHTAPGVPAPGHIIQRLAASDA